jgi:hypothetical protein
VFLVAWVAAALVAANAGILDHALAGRPWVAPVSIWGTTLTVALIVWRWGPLRRWSSAVDLGGPILFHVVRIAYGASFLWLLSRGQISEVFAMRAGPGDIAAGALAIPAAIAAGRSSRWSRPAVLVWNLFALADILLVLVTAQSLLFSGQGASLAFFARLPWSLLAFLVVPAILLTHALVFWRLWASRPGR